VFTATRPTLFYRHMLLSMWRNCAGNTTLPDTQAADDFCEWVCIAACTHQAAVGIYHSSRPRHIWRKTAFRW